MSTYVVVLCLPLCLCLPAGLIAVGTKEEKKKKNPTDYQADLFEERVHRSCQEALKEKK